MPSDWADEQVEKMSLFNATNHDKRRIADALRTASDASLEEAARELQRQSAFEDKQADSTSGSCREKHLYAAQALHDAAAAIRAMKGGPRG